MAVKIHIPGHITLTRDTEVKFSNYDKEKNLVDVELVSAGLKLTGVQVESSICETDSFLESKSLSLKPSGEVFVASGGTGKTRKSTSGSTVLLQRDVAGL